MQRAKYIDLLKGLGIIFVFLGHTAIPEDIKKYIYSFHMPLFFFISGYLFNYQASESFSTFVTKKIRTIYIPCLVGGIFSVIIYFGFNLETILKFIPKILLGGEYVLETKNDPLWFLYALLIVNIVFYLIVKVSRGKQKIIPPVIFASSLIGYFSSIMLKINPLPFHVLTTFTGLAFYGLGYLFKDYKGKINFKSHKIVLVSLGLLALNYYLANQNPRTMMIANTYPGYFYLYLMAFLGIFTYYFIARYLEENHILEYIGKNSIVFLILNYPMIFMLSELKKILSHNFYGCSLFVILQILLIIPIVYIVNNLFPVLIGKSLRKEVKPVILENRVSLKKVVNIK